jgi:hypothetical protein
MTKIATFCQFINNMNESDGFGTSPFLLEKSGDIYNYFFNLDIEKSEDQSGFHLIIGKYSDQEVIEGPKNSYCVLTINQISPEIIDDIAVKKEDIPQTNSEKFKMGGNDISRLMEYVFKCVTDYLESNPKVTRIYDEMQDNLFLEGKGEYIEYMKSLAISQLGGNWSIQQGATKNSVIISR